MRLFPTPRHISRALALALSGALAACGGGGGGGGPDGTTVAVGTGDTGTPAPAPAPAPGAAPSPGPAPAPAPGSAPAPAPAPGSAPAPAPAPGSAPAPAPAPGSAPAPAPAPGTSPAPAPSTPPLTTAPGSDPSVPEVIVPGAGAGSGSASAAGGGSGTSGGTPSVGTPGTPPAPTPVLAESSGVAGTGPKTLVLYDAPSGSEWEKLGKSYAIMLRNLLGHFDARVDMVPVHLYAAGQMTGYDATFYLGAAYNNPLPPSLLADAAATPKPLVWFRYNLWELAGDAALRFTETRGISFAALRGLNAVPSAANPAPGFFDTVQYKGQSFVKYYSWDAARNQVAADPDAGVTAITDPAKASAVVTMSNPVTGEQAPYVVRSGNFWYVADMPFSYIGPRDRYLVIADLLHDMIGIQHPETHQAMVRLEDVDAKASVGIMKLLTDYLAGKRVPFSIAAIPHYKDPLGHVNDGTPQDIPLAKATNLRQILDYALPRGAELVMHGYTHQYGAQKNPWTGVSGDDYEFWNNVDNAPVLEDSTAWALGRLNAGLAEFNASGYRPIAWETPHYVASPLTSKAVPQLFSTTYQRVVYFTADKPDFTARPGKDFSAGQIFPYVIQRDYYGQRVLPENLGNIEYDIHQIDPTSFLVYTAQDILLNARYALTVRDGYASFFFHPFWLESILGQPGFSDFKKVVEGITALGYTWVVPSTAR